MNGSKPFEKWSNPSSDTSFRYTLYLFNVTNANQVQLGLEKPIVKEMGPYEFIQKKNFKIFNWDSNNTLLNYKMKRTFYHDSTCKGNLDDVVTILNVPLVTFGNLVKHKATNKIIDYLVKREFMNKYPLFVTQKVGDLLFHGYKDKLTKFLARAENIAEYLHIKIDGPKAISKEGVFSLLGQVCIFDNLIQLLNFLINFSLFLNLEK